MKVHKLKCDPIPFTRLLSGDKTFEFRVNDRDYQVGDILELHETTCSARDWQEQAKELDYTGLMQERIITHMTTSEDGYGVPEGCCILSIKPVDLKEVQPLEDSPFTQQVGGEHYKKYGPYQPWTVFSKWLTSEELKGAMKKEVIAYLCREADKNGLEDIKKAFHTLQIYLELVKHKENQANE